MEVDNGNMIFDFNAIIKFLKIHRLKIVITSILGLLVAIIIANFVMVPKYSSDIDILVNQKINDQQAQYNIQQADLQAINTYKDVLKKPIILNSVLREIREKDNYKGSIVDLQDALNITNETNSQVITVTAEAENPYVARDIANIVGKVFTQKIKKIMQVNNVTIVSSAQVNEKPISPNKKMIILLGLIIGVVIGILIAIFKELMNTTVDNASYLTESLNLINLGTIYHIDNGERSLSIVTVVDTDTDSQLKRRV